MLERMPWTAPQITRQNVPYVAGDRQMPDASPVRLFQPVTPGSVLR